MRDPRPPRSQVLLETCEETVKCAQRELTLRAASAPLCDEEGSSGGGRGGGGAAAQGASRPSPLGADDLLPLLVFVVVRSRVASLPAELAYIADYLPLADQHGQLGYAVTSMQCACRVALELNWCNDSLIAAAARSRSGGDELIAGPHDGSATASERTAGRDESAP